MSKIVKVSGGDYRIEVQGTLNPATGKPTTGGNIILDTLSSGTTNGMVTILGNLDVKGITSTVESTDTYIKDTVITLNYGQGGTGIGNGTGPQVSGIEIDRGSAYKALMLFSETLQHWDNASSSYINGTFTLKTADGTLSGLQIGAIANDGAHDFTFDMQGGANVLSVVNSGGIVGVSGWTLAQSAAAYASNVTQPYNIPNKQWVNGYVAATGGMADVTNIHYPISGTPVITNVVCASGSVISTVWDGTNHVEKWRVSSAGVTMGNILVANDTVQNLSGSTPLILFASNNNIELNGVLNLDNQATDITSASSTANKLYSKSSEGPGRTGIYFTSNTTYGSVSYNNDELVSKNRAVLLSILL